MLQNGLHFVEMQSELHKVIWVNDLGVRIGVTVLVDLQQHHTSFVFFALEDILKRSPFLQNQLGEF